MFKSEDTKKTENEIAEKDEKIRQLTIALNKTSKELEDNKKKMMQEATKTAEISKTESVIKLMNDDLHNTNKELENKIKELEDKNSGLETELENKKQVLDCKNQELFFL